MNGPLKLRPGSVTTLDRLAEPHHQHLFGLVNGEHRAVADDDDDQQHEQRNNACNGGPHRVAPALLLRLAGRGSRRTSRRQFAQRQIRHDALPGRRTAAVIDQFLGAAENTLHGLQIDALPGDVGRLLVFLVDFQEARALALGLGDRLLLVAFGDLDDLRGAALGVGNDAVGIGLGLVLQALEIGARGLHVAERVDHLRRRIDLLHLHLLHQDARTVAVQRLLHQFLHAGFGRGAGAGQDRLDVGFADDFAHRAFGDRLHGAFRDSGC